MGVGISWNTRWRLLTVVITITIDMIGTKNCWLPSAPTYTEWLIIVPELLVHLFLCQWCSHGNTRGDSWEIWGIQCLNICASWFINMCTMVASDGGSCGIFARPNSCCSDTYPQCMAMKWICSHRQLVLWGGAGVENILVGREAGNTHKHDFCRTKKCRFLLLSRRCFLLTSRQSRCVSCSESGEEGWLRHA